VVGGRENAFGGGLAKKTGIARVRPVATKSFKGGMLPFKKKKSEVHRGGGLRGEEFS